MPFGLKLEGLGHLLICPALPSLFGGFVAVVSSSLAPFPHFAPPPATQRGASAVGWFPPAVAISVNPCASFAHSVTEVSITRALTRVVYWWNLPPLGLFMGLGVGAF